MIVWHPKNGSSPDFGWRYLDTSTNLTFPWYTFGALQFLSSLNLSNMSVFEYGCGISSLWWKTKAKEWKGIDSNPEWSNKCGCKYTQDKLEYLTACTETKHDVIIIDGIYRDECTEYALKSINLGGYIVIDNWDQATTDTPASYWKNSKQLLEKYETWVFKEETHEDWKTAIFQII